VLREQICSVSSAGVCEKDTRIHPQKDRGTRKRWGGGTSLTPSAVESIIRLQFEWRKLQHISIQQPLWSVGPAVAPHTHIHTHSVATGIILQLSPGWASNVLTARSLFGRRARRVRLTHASSKSSVSLSFATDNTIPRPITHTGVSLFNALRKHTQIRATYTHVSCVPRRGVEDCFTYSAV
jgi:hypothetical protein